MTETALSTILRGQTQLTEEQVGLIKRTTLDAATGCLLWLGGRSSSGYGIVMVRGRQVYAHRRAFELFAGRALRPKEVVRHRCDAPLCVNYDHLLAGTQADNIADAVARGRIARGPRLPQTKLTIPQVREIRRIYSLGGRSQESLAGQFGVQQMTISYIVRGVTWKDQ